jgi:hypothetical protein
MHPCNENLRKEKACHSLSSLWQAFMKICGGLCFILIVRAQHALEAENRRGKNGAPGADDENPTA